MFLPIYHLIHSIYYSMLKIERKKWKRINMYKIHIIHIILAYGWLPPLCPRALFASDFFFLLALDLVRSNLALCLNVHKITTLIKFNTENGGHIRSFSHNHTATRSPHNTYQTFNSNWSENSFQHRNAQTV